MEWLWAAVGGLGISSSVLGYSLRRSVKAYRTLLDNRTEERIKPKCLCRHWFNEHEEGGGKCLIGEETISGASWDLHNGLTQTKRTCACVHYLGPDPALSGLWQGNSGRPKKP